MKQGDFDFGRIDIHFVWFLLFAVCLAQDQMFCCARMGWLGDLLGFIAKPIVKWITGDVKRPKVETAPPPPQPVFQVIEATGTRDSEGLCPHAFDHLVGMEWQQGQLEVLSSMMWTHWDDVEKRVRKDKRQRVAFLLFSGGPGSGKTAHARALANYFQIPCILVNPGNATFVNSEGHTTMKKVIEYCLKTKSAVLLLDEIDVYAQDEGFMAEVRQFVDGASKIDDGAIVFVIGTTNKSLNSFPDDLLHRVLVEVKFDNVDETDQKTSQRKQPGGFQVEQCRAFWDRNAICLREPERHRLAQCSTGLSPRDLQLWVQRVLIITCWQARQKKMPPPNDAAWNSYWKDVLPTSKDFLGLAPAGLPAKKPPAQLPEFFHYLKEPVMSWVIEGTTWPPIKTSSESSCYVATSPDGSEMWMVHTIYIGNTERIEKVQKDSEIPQARL